MTTAPEVSHISHYSAPCGWNALLPPRTGGRALEGDRDCDVAIVGAGYTGLAAARRWIEHAPRARVLLLDACRIGEGNAGRNSGFLLEVSLASDVAAGRLARMRECNRLIFETMSELVARVAAAGIPCGLARTGTYRAAAGPQGERALARYRAFLDAMELPCQVLDRGELDERIGSAYYRRGLYSPHCYLVQPAALVRGLADLLPSGVSLYENSPVTALERRDKRWRLITPRAAITAATVILANNAFCKELGIASSRIAAIYTYAALTPPLPARVRERLGSEQSWGLLPTHRMGCTLRRTPDGRLLIRSVYAYERDADLRRVSVELRDSLERRFPQLGKPGFEHVWGGATGFTMNGAPVFGRWGPGLFVSAGCNGGGVVKGSLFGRVLVDRALGERAPDIAALFGRAAWMPPEPLRRIGFHAIAALERRRGRAEM